MLVHVHALYTSIATCSYTCIIAKTVHVQNNQLLGDTPEIIVALTPRSLMSQSQRLYCCYTQVYSSNIHTVHVQLILMSLCSPYPLIILVHNIVKIVWGSPLTHTKLEWFQLLKE